MPTNNRINCEKLIQQNTTTQIQHKKRNKTKKVLLQATT
jgi:hypothetical protein